MRLRDNQEILKYFKNYPKDKELQVFTLRIIPGVTFFYYQ